MEESEFYAQIKNVKGDRVHKVTGSLGVYDAFKWYRKHRPEDKKFVLTDSQYFHIIREVNKLLREELLKSEDLNLPAKMGRLEVRGREASIKRVDGKIKTNLPIDWQATLQLWYEDQESLEKKLLVRSNVPKIFKIYYNKSKANYNNKSFYQFTPNRELKILLKKAIKSNHKFDAFSQNY